MPLNWGLVWMVWRGYLQILVFSLKLILRVQNPLILIRRKDPGIFYFAWGRLDCFIFIMNLLRFNGSSYPGDNSVIVYERSHRIDCLLPRCWLRFTLRRSSRSGMVCSTFITSMSWVKTGVSQVGSYLLFLLISTKGL